MYIEEPDDQEPPPPGTELPLWIMAVLIAAILMAVSFVLNLF